MPGPKFLRVTVKMPHGHQAGWAPEEIGRFIDSYCRDGDALPVPGEPKIEQEQVVLPYESETLVWKAALHYTTDTGLRSEREWVSQPASVEGPDLVTAPRPPADANTWFLTLTDEHGATVSTTVQFSPEQTLSD